MNETMTNSSNQFGELTLRDYVRLLSRQKLLVGAIFGAVMAAAVAFTLITPAAYQSTSSVLIRTSMNSQVFPTVGQSQILQFVRTPAGEFAFVSSTSFQAAAAELADSTATVRPSHDPNADFSSIEAQVINFTGTADSPAAAQNAAQVWAELYLQQRAQSSLVEIDAAIEGISGQIKRLEVEKAEILAPLAPIDAIMIGEQDADTVARLTSQRLALQQSLDDELLPVRFQLRTLSDDLGRLQIAQELAGREDISARINTAAPFGRQVRPQPARNLALGAVLGLLLGVGAALLNDSLRTRISGRDDIELIAPGLQVLAEVPPLPEDADADERREISARYNAEMERVVSAVAYQAAHCDEGLRVLVTSPQIGEGKSTLVQQLAQRLTESYVDTVVLDADLRRPVLHDRFGASNRGDGLGGALRDSAAIAPRLTTVGDNNHLRFLAAGAPTDAAASLLRRSFATAVTELDHDGVLLIDSPPVLAVTDAEVMANSVDRVIVVVRANRTTRPELQQTLERLAATRASILGVVLVGVTSPSTGGYGYQYGYGAAIEVDPDAAQPSPDQPVYGNASNPTVSPVTPPVRPELVALAAQLTNDDTGGDTPISVPVPTWLGDGSKPAPVRPVVTAFQPAPDADLPAWLPPTQPTRRSRTVARKAAVPIRSRRSAPVASRPRPLPRPHARPVAADPDIDLRNRPHRPTGEEA